MARKFIYTTGDITEAENLCPFEPAKIMKVYGGYMAFEWLSDYEIWLNQQ